MKINYGINRVVRVPHKKKRIEHRNGTMEVKSCDLSDSTDIRRAIRHKHPGWQITGWAPSLGPWIEAENKLLDEAVSAVVNTPGWQVGGGFMSLRDQLEVAFRSAGTIKYLKSTYREPTEEEAAARQRMMLSAPTDQRGTGKEIVEVEAMFTPAGLPVLYVNVDGCCQYRLTNFGRLSHMKIASKHEPPKKGHKGRHVAQNSMTIYGP